MFYVNFSIFYINGILFVSAIYLAFAFKKCKTIWDANGKPSYVNSSLKTSSGQT